MGAAKTIPNPQKYSGEFRTSADEVLFNMDAGAHTKSGIMFGDSFLEVVVKTDGSGETGNL